MLPKRFRFMSRTATSSWRPETSALDVRREIGIFMASIVRRRNSIIAAARQTLSSHVY